MYFFFLSKLLSILPCATETIIRYYNYRLVLRRLAECAQPQHNKIHFFQCGSQRIRLYNFCFSTFSSLLLLLLLFSSSYYIFPHLPDGRGILNFVEVLCFFFPSHFFKQNSLGMIFIQKIMYPKFFLLLSSFL